MEISKVELGRVEAAVDAVESQVEELLMAQLALVGGGQGDVSFG